MNGKVVYSNLKREVPAVWMTDTVECVPGVRTASTVMSSRGGTDLPVRLVNTKEETVQLPRGTKLGSLHDVLSISTSVSKESAIPESRKPATAEEHIEKILSEVHPELTKSQKSRLESLLKNYSDILSVDEYDMLLTDLIQHDIDTGTERPVRQALRKTPMAYNQIIDQHIQSMLQQGLIEPSKGEWASNIVLVQKKDKSFRFCLDYRAVNQKNFKEVFPIPRIDASLDALAGSAWFSTLDLRSGYYQVPLNPRDANKTSFISRGGCYKWKVLPMGLCNSAWTFQRLMNMVLASLTYSICLVYLDDIIVMAPSVEEHQRRLEEVFKRIREAKLKLRPDKCRILQKEVTFLGHVVSDAGIAMDPKKLEAVRDWPTPKNLKETRGFMGLCAYYRKFIRSFSETARPLHALTRKNEPFVWSGQCQTTFDELKTKLTTAPIMTLPRDEVEYILDTDASGWAIGAVLSQVQDAEERIVSYGSRLYSKAEEHYCTTRKELLAIVYFVKYFKQYLLGRRFRIRTDHAALQWLLRKPEPIGQQSRWVEQLAAFDFEVIHRPGVRHQNADVISRIPCRQCGWEGDNVDIVAPVKEEEHVDLSPAAMKDLQFKNPDIIEFRELMRNYSDRRPAWHELDGLSEETKVMWSVWSEFELVDDVLYRRSVSPVTKDVDLRLVVPKAVRKQVFHLIHDMTGGHLGVVRTREQLRQRVYWPGWSRDVDLFVKACEPCARFHRGKAPKKGMLHPMMASSVWETIGIDLTGPYPRSSNGFKYILTVVDNFSKFAFAFPLRISRRRQ